jgi:hypothetical protein
LVVRRSSLSVASGENWIPGWDAHRASHWYWTGRRPEEERRGAMQLLELHFSLVHATQKPPAMAFTGLEADQLLRGLIKKDPDPSRFTDNRSEQHQRRTIRLRWRRRSRW